MNNVNLTPEQFIQSIVDRTTKMVEERVRRILSEPQQAKSYEVTKQTPSGPVKVAISIPQAMTDLAEQLVISNQLVYRQTMVTGALLAELEEHRKLGAKLSKKARRKEIEEDDDE